MAKFRKKPVVIDAVQWWPPGNERHTPIAGVDAISGPCTCGDVVEAMATFTTPNCDASCQSRKLEFVISTLEGLMQVSPGDWVITGVKGEQYPCKPDIFDLTYEAVCLQNDLKLEKRTTKVEDMIGIHLLQGKQRHGHCYS
jgi:hypothetical protein